MFNTFSLNVFFHLKIKKWNRLLTPFHIDFNIHLSWLMRFMWCHLKSRHFFVRESFFPKSFTASKLLLFHQNFFFLAITASQSVTSFTLFRTCQKITALTKRFTIQCFVSVCSIVTDVKWSSSFEKISFGNSTLPCYDPWRRGQKRLDSVLLICVAQFSFCTAAGCHE